MQMYNETRRKTSSVRLFLQRKRLMRDGFWEGMYYKKRRVSLQAHPFFGHNFCD